MHYSTSLVTKSSKDVNKMILLIKIKIISISEKDGPAGLLLFLISYLF